MMPIPNTNALIWAAAACTIGLLAGWLVTWAVLRHRRIRESNAVAEELSAAREDVLRLTRSLAEASARLERIDPLETALKEKDERVGELTRRCAKLETLIRQDRLEARDRSAWLQDAQNSLREAYRSLSADALKENNDTFIDLAQSVLRRFVDQSRSDLDARGQAVDHMIKPLKASLERYESQIQAMERARESAYGGISQQMIHLAQTQEQLQKEAGRLATALRTPQVRGRWGELTLKRVAELSGMQSRCDFIEQPSGGDGDRKSRPDMLVHLPGGRQIVIDAKVPLNAYLEALEAENEDQREERLSRHADHVLSHIHQLSRKAYWSQFQPTPEFVVLFIPGETFFAAALAQNPSLIEEGVKRNIILATPTTLISLLKSVAFGWRQEKTTENARRICDLGQELYDRIRTLTGHLQTLGREIRQVVGAYNRTVGSFERRVLASARRFEDLGLSTKDGREPPHVEAIPNVPVPPKTTDPDEPIA